MHAHTHTDTHMHRHRRTDTHTLVSSTSPTGTALLNSHSEGQWFCQSLCWSVTMLVNQSIGRQIKRSIRPSNQIKSIHPSNQIKSNRLTCQVLSPFNQQLKMNAIQRKSDGQTNKSSYTSDHMCGRKMFHEYYEYCFYHEHLIISLMTRVVPLFSIVMRGEFSRRSVKKTDLISF